MHSVLPTSVREKRHRLPKEAYVGRIHVAFTACVADRNALFHEPAVVQVFLAILREELGRFGCSAPVYCFMPDHLHVIVQGGTDRSDTRGAIAAFKQKSGFWLRHHHADCAWQKDFWDHIIRCSEDLGKQVRYIAENPVRRGLAREWSEYPHTGAIGHELREILANAAFLAGR
jgi:putative transposase